MTGQHRSSNTFGDPVDDWLAEQGDINWLDDPRRDEAADTGWSAAAAHPEAIYSARDPSSAGPGSRQRGHPPAGPETIARRRWFLALLAIGLVVATAIGVVVATSGGGGPNGAPTAAGTTPPTASTPQPTSPSETTTTTGAGQSTTPTPTSPSSALRVTLPAGGRLSSGDTGPAVVTLQKALAALRLDVGKPDGDFGSMTRAAVIAFQTAHGLDPDGIVGPITARSLNQALAALSSG